MVNYNSLKPYLTREVEDRGGEVSKDYKSFERKYHNILKKICKEKGYELTWFHGNHYEFSAMIRADYKYIYMSISDIRYWKNEWFNHILIRYAKHAKDYGGWHTINDHTDLPRLDEKLEKMFSQEPRFNG